MSSKGNLTQRTLHAAKWGYLGAAGKLLIQLGSQILLARILGPAEYGMFAVGAIVVGVANYFADASIGSALVQRKQISDDIVRFIATWQLAAGLVVTAVLLLFAPHIAGFLTHPEATPLLRALSFVCLISALTSAPANLLRRELNFKALQLGQLAGFAVGYLLVGIPMALAGAGVWSLVAAWLVQASCTLVLVWKAARPPIGLRFRADDGVDTLKFGGHALLSNLATWSGSNLDRIIVSRAFPAHELGVYHVVNNLVSTAITQILSTLQAVTFSSTSQVSADAQRIRASFLTAAEAAPVVVLPIFATLAVTAKIVLIGLYGTKWQEGVELLQPVALTAAMYGLSGTITPLLWASNHIRHESRVQIISSVLIGVACYAAALQGSIVTVAWALFGVASMRYAYLLRFAARSYGVPLKQLGRHLMAGLLTTALCCVGAWGISTLLEPVLLAAPVLTLLATILTCGLVLALSVACAVRFAASDAFRALVKGFIAKRRKTAAPDNSA
ncbi:lipopolysaccharide biosynthesis protein [Pelomonas sp. UHG3]|uniref:Lipopolysaccharide biosynthesis protein n=1 Tax=Roseateles hydrophilus TaxID=2975054 RepID=A0ACC6C5B3_9BURK|nr:lipopolysaccharide biosynthesis protein [Pelomonas sp. UHG3]MCY4743525.1 lipopolysaccharide biosynthesis protein [Pelomonas sp. UHG3]